MLFQNFRSIAIKQMMKMIHPHPTAYFIRYKDHLRLCWYQLGRLKSTTIPYSQPELMLKAAGILKECGIIDGYNEDATRLFCYKHHVHKDAAGRQMIAAIKKTVQWSELSLTQHDVRAFAAHFAFNVGAPIAFKSDTPVIQMFPNNNNTKRTA